MRKSPSSKNSKKRSAPKNPGQRGTTNRGSRRASRTTKPQDISQRQQLSSGTRTSSLDPHAKFEAEPEGEPAPAKQRMDAGDLQSVSAVEEASMESTAELADEGQDLEAERVEAVEDSAENDGKPRRARELPIIKVPKFKDRNRL